MFKRFGFACAYKWVALNFRHPVGESVPLLMVRLIKASDTRTADGYRNRVILELLYDTGIRRAEVSNIKVSDLDLNAGYIRIHGKGDKDRIVPLSDRVC